MLNKYKKSRSEGFTIIEVMIVLAIAGLILLIVFLAIPALQRSSRNTQRKNDATNVAAALGNYINGSNGAMPTILGTATAGSIQVCDSDCTKTPKITETSKLGYYDNTNVKLDPAPAVSKSVAYTAADTFKASTNVDKDTIVIIPKAACNDGTLGTVDYSARTLAVLFVNEAAGTKGNIQCVEQ